MPKLVLRFIRRDGVARYYSFDLYLLAVVVGVLIGSIVALMIGIGE